jgi:hypothetical protein
MHLFEAKRRVRASTVEVLNREFRAEHVFAQYRDLYEHAVSRAEKEH